MIQCHDPGRYIGIRRIVYKTISLSSNKKIIYKMKACLCVMILLAVVLSQTCPRINFSSDGVHPDDLVKRGTTTSVWAQDAANPIIIGSSKKQDFIYVMVENDSGAFSSSDFNLEYDNQKYANSTFVLDKSLKEGTSFYEYAVRIIYHCNNYGGALVNYKLSFTLPGCGSSYVHWKKLCGNPTQPRDGFTMDLEENGQNRTIVKNGMIVNSLEFDKDLDNYFYSVPRDMSKTVFYLRMESTSPTEESQNDPLIAILRDVVMSTPETKISAPRVDADSSVLTPSLNGSMVQFGGIINQTPQKVQVNYECLNRDQDSYVEVTVPLDYFKDISLFFKKECKTPYSYFNILGVFSATSPFAFLLRLFLGLAVLVLLLTGLLGCVWKVNEKYQDERVTRVMEKIAALRWIRETSLSKQLVPYKEMSSVPREEVVVNVEEESKSNEIKNNYGTL